jgi:uncharacterized protein YyaL (SSP411 family)
MILGLLALYQSDPDSTWFQSALELAEEMQANFVDPDGGFFDTRHDHDALITRPLWRCWRWRLTPAVPAGANRQKA